MSINEIDISINTTIEQDKFRATCWRSIQGAAWPYLVEALVEQPRRDGRGEIPRVIREPPPGTAIGTLSESLLRAERRPGSRTVEIRGGHEGL